MGVVDIQCRLHHFLASAGGRSTKFAVEYQVCLQRSFSTVFSLPSDHLPPLCNRTCGSVIPRAMDALVHAIIAAAVGEAAAAKCEIEPAATAAALPPAIYALVPAVIAAAVGEAAAAKSEREPAATPAVAQLQHPLQQHGLGGETRDAASIEDMPMELLYNVFGC